MLPRRADQIAAIEASARARALARILAHLRDRDDLEVTPLMVAALAQLAASNALCATVAADQQGRAA